jgi:hypothetical protein
MCLQSLEFEEPNSKYTKRNEKDKYYSCWIFSFSFLFVYFESGSENSRDGKNTSYEHAQYFFENFRNLEICILRE